MFLYLFTTKGGEACITFVILEISFLVIEQMELFSLFLSSYEKDELISYVRPTEVDQILIRLERDYVVEKVE